MIPPETDSGFMLKERVVQEGWKGERRVKGEGVGEKEEKQTGRGQEVRGWMLLCASEENAISNWLSCICTPHTCTLTKTDCVAHGFFQAREIVAPLRVWNVSIVLDRWLLYLDLLDDPVGIFTTTCPSSFSSSVSPCPSSSENSITLCSTRSSILTRRGGLDDCELDIIER